MHESFGFNQLLCWTRLGGFDTHKVLQSMERMEKYVMPHFRKAEQKAA